MNVNNSTSLEESDSKVDKENGDNSLDEVVKKCLNKRPELNSFELNNDKNFTFFVSNCFEDFYKTNHLEDKVKTQIEKVYNIDYNFYNCYYLKAHNGSG
jgi:hypothetical protein